MSRSQQPEVTTASHRELQPRESIAYDEELLLDLYSPGDANMKNFTRREMVLGTAGVGASFVFCKSAWAQQSKDAQQFEPTPISSSGKWEMSTPLPKAMGEVVGVAIGQSMFVFGGLDDADGEVPYGAAFRFDASISKWTTLRQMPEPAHHIMATEHGGKIYIFGGFTLPPKQKMLWKPSAGSWLYDPATDKYTALAALPRPRGAGYAVTVGDKIYVIGGVASNPTASVSEAIPLGIAGKQTCVGFVDEYDPVKNIWMPRASMPTPRNHYLAGVVDGKIYALNGRTGSVFVNMASVTDLVEMYDPERDVWTLVGRAITNRGDVNGAVHGNKLYVTGGEYQTAKVKEAFWAFESYNAVENTWETLPHVNISRHGFAAAFIGNTLHVVGGSFQSDGMPGVYSPTATHETFLVDGEERG